MHSAPAVSFPVGRSRFQGWLVGLTGVGGVLAGMLWLVAVDAIGWRQWLMAILLSGAGTVAWVAWRRSPAGRLHWDGQVWRWTTAIASVSGRLTVHHDLQSCLVLSLRTELGVRIWLWPERRSEAALWHALRQAVFSRGGTLHVLDAAQDASKQVKA